MKQSLSLPSLIACGRPPGMSPETGRLGLCPTPHFTRGPGHALPLCLSFLACQIGPQRHSTKGGEDEEINPCGARGEYRTLEVLTLIILVSTLIVSLRRKMKMASKSPAAFPREPSRTSPPGRCCFTCSARLRASTNTCLAPWHGGSAHKVEPLLQVIDRSWSDGLEECAAAAPGACELPAGRGCSVITGPSGSCTRRLSGSSQ